MQSLNHNRRGRVLALTHALLLAVPALLPAQTARAAWTVDPRTSLVWWQIDPNYGHLWATTCPKDRPGSLARAIVANSGSTSPGARRPPTQASPITGSRFIRAACDPGCRTAVTGTVTAENAALEWCSGTDPGGGGQPGHWPEPARFLHAAGGAQDRQRPYLTFEIDTLENVQPGDTLRAIAVGKFTMNGVSNPVRVPVRAWPDAGGLARRGPGLNAGDRPIRVYKVSRAALGMGATLARWQTAHFGVDIILQRDRS